MADVNAMAYSSVLGIDSSIFDDTELHYFINNKEITITVIKHTFMLSFITHVSYQSVITVWVNGSVITQNLVYLY